jgi:hypothetical protein
MRCNVVECSAEATTGRILIGCVHEHMREVRWCDECYVDAKQDRLCCSLCWDYGTGTLEEHPLGHQCDIRIVTVTA